MSNLNYVDSLILAALRRDDEKALNHLFEQHYNRLFRMGLKTGVESSLVQEAIQLIFLDLWQYRQTLSEIDSFEAYLISALKRRIAKTLTQQKRAKTEELQMDLLSVASYEAVLIEQQTTDLTREKLQSALDQLTNRQKEIVVMRYFDELSYDEIAERTQLQKDTLYKILHTAIGRLKGLIISPNVGEI